MKKLLACLLCLMLLCTMSPLMLTPATAAGGNELLKTYADAANGDLLHVAPAESMITNSYGFYGNLGKSSGAFLSLMKSGAKTTGDRTGTYPRNR